MNIERCALTLYIYVSISMFIALSFWGAGVVPEFVITYALLRIDTAPNVELYSARYGLW